MNTKILLIALSAAAFSSCSTAYKSGQTPDDVYYSPVRVVDETRNEKREDVRQTESTYEDNRTRMRVYDRRWRDLDYEYDYDYGYNYSPYNYCYCTCNSYGYYYNPYYYSKPVYYPRVLPTAPVNSTPRMTNLNTYKNYSTAVAGNPKTGNGTNWVKPARQYNNSNNNGSRVGNVLRQVFTPNPGNNNNSNSTTRESNNTRTYSPSTPSSSSSSSRSSSSSGSGSGGSVSRPGR